MCPDLNTGKEISNFIRHLGQVAASTNERRFDVNMNETVTQQHTISNIYSLIFSYLQRRKISCNLRYKVIMQLIFFFCSFVFVFLHNQESFRSDFKSNHLPEKSCEKLTQCFSKQKTRSKCNCYA